MQLLCNNKIEINRCFACAKYWYDSYENKRRTETKLKKDSRKTLHALNKWKIALNYLLKFHFRILHYIHSNNFKYILTIF